MATIGKLAVQITADTAGLASGLASAGRQTDDFQNRIGALTGKLKILGPAALAAGGAFAVGMVKSVANTADELAKLSARTGVAVEDLSRLQYAAGLSGVSNDTLTASIDKLSRGMAEAANGAGPAAEAFKAMGLSVKNQDGTLKSQSDMLSEISDRFQSYADGAEKTALAQQLFGRAGGQLIPLLNSGAKGLKDMADESDRLGNTISTNTAKQAEIFNDNITRLTTAMGGLGRTIAGPVIDAMAKFTTSMLDAWKQGDTLFGMLEAGFKRLTQADTIESARKKVNELEEAMHKMRATPGFDEANMGALNLSNNLRDARARLAELLAEQQKSLAKPEAQQAAPVVSSGAASTSGTVDPQKALDEQAAREREYWAGRIQRVQEGLMSESELLDHKFQQDIERLNASLLTEQERMVAREALEFEHLNRMAEIEEEGRVKRVEAEQKAAAEIERIRLASMSNLERFTAMSYSDQAKTVFDAMREQLTSVTTNSKAMFNVQKAANIAQAVMDTYAGATRALKDYPAPISFAVAGATMAAGMARVASIKSQTFGGASASMGGASGGGVAATNGMAQTAQQMNQTITIQGMSSGDIFSGDAVRTLIDRLIDAQRNGARIVLA